MSECHEQTKAALTALPLALGRLTLFRIFMKTYYWDFFGPDARPMAEHFLRHLDEFLVVNGYAGCTTGLSSEALQQQSVWCRTGPEWERAIESTLAPKRVVDEPS